MLLLEADRSQIASAIAMSVAAPPRPRWVRACVLLDGARLGAA
jgi:hypothetical protein